MAAGTPTLDLEQSVHVLVTVLRGTPMDLIIPCRSTISERFPIASFTVRVPSDRLYEVACTTDPRLLHADFATHRTADNFYTSRSEGLLHARDGESTFFLPPQQLRRFARSRRIYYALGSYGGPRGESARFSVSPDAPERVPSIAVGADFTGRSLDRARIGGRVAAPVYGAGPGALLRWGGDALSAGTEGSTEAGDEVAPPKASHEDKVRDFAPEAHASAANDVDLDANQDSADALASSLSASPDDADASQDSADALAVDDQGENTRTGHDTAVDETAFALADQLDDPALDLGVDPDDVEDGAEQRSRTQGYPEANGQEAVELHDAAEGMADDTDQAESSSWRYGHGPGASDAGTGESVVDGAQSLGEKESDYSEEVPPEESLPVGPAALPLATVPLDIAEKVRILRIIGRAESGADGYAAVNADTEFNDPKHACYRLHHLGLSWGFLMFTQRSGALGRVLAKAKSREVALSERPSHLPDEQRFSALFGPDWQALLATTDPAQTPDPDARVAPIAGGLLWEEPWIDRFRKAGRVPYVQAAQNEIGVRDYFDRMMPIARGLGFDTARKLALLVDRAVHMGVGRACAWVMNAVGPIRTEAERASVLRALGHAPDDLRGFQHRQPDLTADGRWNALTHAALLASLRPLGGRSPIAIPTPTALMHAFVEAARNTPFEDRVQALIGSDALDDSVSFEIGEDERQ